MISVMSLFGWYKHIHEGELLSWFIIYDLCTIFNDFLFNATPHGGCFCTGCCMLYTMPSTNIGTLGKNVQRWLIVYPFHSKKFTIFF